MEKKMASVLTFEKKKENNSAEKKLDGFMTRHRKPILITALVLVIVAVGICIYVGIVDSQRKAGIAGVDKIEFKYTNGFEALTDEEIVARQNEALEGLKEFTGKKGVVGVRANLLAAEISFAKKDYVNAKDYWIAASDADPKAYTSPEALYNAGVCFEESGDVQTALTYYQKAFDHPEFLMKPRALMEIGRVKESSGDYAGASEAYQKMVDDYSSDEWTNLAQSRLLQLKIDGKVSD